MSCVLNAGIDFPCDDGAGGVKQGTILIAHFDTISATTVVAGEMTVLTQDAGTYFYRYRVKGDNSDFVATHTVSDVNGTQYWETVISMILVKMSKESSVLMKLLASKRTVIIMQDLNDVWHAFGIERGCEKMGGTNTATSGKVMGDLNGYNLGFTAKEQNLVTVDSSLIATLSISVDVS